MNIRLFTDESGSTAYEVADPRDTLLASWLTFDLGTVPLFCLDALQMIDDVATDRAEHQEYEGNVYTVYFRKDQVTVSHLFMEDKSEVYSFDHVRDAVEQYWLFQKTVPPATNMIRQYRLDLSIQDADLLRWEDTWQRRHPYRGRLGIPETGPA